MPLFPPTPGVLQKIDHFVVLMFENRSFDHILGYENARDPAIEGVGAASVNLEDPANPASPQVSITRAAAYGMPFDPGHEFGDVALQLYAPNDPPTRRVTMGGFVASALKTAAGSADAARVMQCFEPAQLPVFTALAREFAIYNYWHSSLPGPTWPNRFFVHAATSGGLIDSPSTGQILEGFDFANGTIYDRLEAANLTWRIYHDGLPQTAGIDRLRKYYISPFTQNFAFMEDFAADVAGGDLPHYTFIEPCYDTGNNYLNGNSMHPMNDIRKGEALLKAVYEAIRNSPLWPSTMLIVTFDEHGGFYDHVPPPSTTPTGDDDRYRKPGEGFEFDQLGVRVPSVVVSAYTQAGSVIGASGSAPFDHTSILRTVEGRFGLPPLTRRDAAAPSLEVAFNLGAPRADAPTALPNPLTDAEANALGIAPVAAVAPPEASLSDNQQSLVDLALKCNLEMHPNDRDALLAEHAGVKTQADAAGYLTQHEAVIEAQRR